MESIYELQPTLANSNYPLKLRADKQTSKGYLHWHE